MRFDKNCLFDYLKYDENEKEIFKDFEIIDCTLNVENDAVYIVFKNEIIQDSTCSKHEFYYYHYYLR